MRVGGKLFGPGAPMIVAEISCNHMGDYDLATQLVQAAKRAGADAVKFQAYGPSDMTAPLDSGPYVLTSRPWKGRPLWELYDEAQTPLRWLPSLYEEARRLDLIPFCSVFSPATIPVLEELGSEVYKIASAEAGWAELVDAAHATGKWVFVSDGVTRDIARSPTTVVLRCVAEYPAHTSKYALRDMDGEYLWGLSDHSMAPVTWITAAALGASVIEAHIMLSDTPVRPLDAGHSLNPVRFQGMARVARIAAEMACRHPVPPDPPEFARRWVWAKDLPKGTRVTRDHVTALRCAQGLPVNEQPPVGSILDRDVSQWEPVP